MRLASEATIRTRLPLRVFADVGSIAVEQENAQLRVTADELSHRIKNLVAIIQSIARQTMHQSTTKEDFEVRFSNRLGAFGRALDLLIANDWRGARIDDLVRSELTPFGVLDGVQISVKGPPLALKPDAARNIGLAIHELATNASKYGALSVPEGKVAIHWGLANSSGRPRFRVTWRESGGPMVTEPTRRGFGRQIIQEVTAHALAGKVTHEFLPAGVRWTLDMPAAFVVGARGELASTAVEARRNEGIGMSASEVMMREQLDRIIARTELRVEQHCSHASALPPYGDQAKSARIQLAQMLAGLAKLKTCRNEFPEPQPGAASGSPVRGPVARKRPSEPTMPIGAYPA